MSIHLNHVTAEDITVHGVTEAEIYENILDDGESVVHIIATTKEGRIEIKLFVMLTAQKGKKK